MSGKVHTYEGSSGKVTFDSRRCIHAAECVHGLPSVFDPKARPWVSPDEASADELAAVVEKCPSGALRFERSDGGPQEEAPAENTITIEPNGPFYARGNLRLIAADGSVFHEDTRVALCRCGASKYKPFCDGSHTEAGFEDAGAMPDPKVKPASDDSGALDIVLAGNGPLVLKGSLKISGASEECSGSGGALCRCGASANKPFCDGQHSKVGFTDQ